MAEPAGLTRARADLAAGRLWKARDRLHGLVVGQPANQAVLELLGEVLWRMGDLPAAGRCWYLTERDGDDVRAAVAAMRERYGPNPGVLWSALPVKAPLEAYPAVVRARIEELEQAIPHDGRRSHRGSPLASRRSRSLRSRVALPLVLALTLGVWCVGVVALIVLVVRAV